MIRKLLKVEFREAFSSMLPVGAGMLVLSALTALNSAVTARIRVSSAGFDWLGALLAVAAAVCCISVLAVYFAATRMEVLLDSFSRFALDLLSSPNGEVKAIFGSLVGVSAVEIVIDAVLWLITQTLLTRKLNLP